MPKSNDDLSALFRSLRPDETTFQESINSVAHDAEQRWPLFKAVAPEKPPEAPALSALDRQRWVNPDKPQAGGRKPALSLPGLSDKMSMGLNKMSSRPVQNTASVKIAVRREPDNSAVEHVVERPRKVHPSLVLKDNAPDPRAPVAAKTLSDESPVTAGRSAGSGAIDQKLVSAPPAPVDTQRDPSAGDRSDESFKSIFSRLKSKSEAVSKPLGNLSSFLDRLGKR